MAHTVFRTCHLCEANCGLKFEVEGDRILEVGPDHDDVFSHGYICPKGAAIAEVHNDPDRLRTPMRRTPQGNFEPFGWEEALSLVTERLQALQRQHGPDSVAAYFGNPITHNHGILALRNSLIRALGTRNVSSASSQDTAPRFCVSYYLYGSSLALPVPDIDRTDYLLMLGANPRASNGSMLTAPDIRGRLRALRERGGRLVVVDPRRTETARDADEHLAILPDGDAPLLLAMIEVLLSEGKVDLARLIDQTVGWPELEAQIRTFTPERVARYVGIDASTIRRLAGEFQAARAPVAYSRVGVCNSAHGTAATLATDLLNLATDRVGQVGGWMFPRPVFDIAPLLRLTGDGHARWKSRVRGLNETLGELPAATLADEIETPGPGQVRGLLTVAGNPVLSVPNGLRLDRAFEQLEFMVSVDIYLNETTRHADVILPPAWGLVDDHVDLIVNSFAVRQVARWSPPVVPKSPDERSDWEILLELVYRLGGGPTGMRPLDWFYRLGRHLGWHWTPDSPVDLVLRLGARGDHFLPWSRGLNLKRLKQATHGLDFGPLEPGYRHRILHRDRKIHLDAPALRGALDELSQAVDAGRDESVLLMIGRRDLKSNNSWMHNVPQLVRGRPRCTLLVHPADAQARGLANGDRARLETDLHQDEVPIEVTEDMRPGVVCLPHGWGHARSAAWQHTAGAHPGVSFNDWVDDRQLESVVGQSILNGVPVRLTASNGSLQAATAKVATAAGG